MSLHELKLRGYPQREVDGLGDCIIVPEAKWNPNWTPGLLQEGARVFNRQLPGSGNIVMKCVQLPEEKDPSPVLEPSKKHKHWTEEENIRLVKRVTLLKLQGAIEIFPSIQKEFGRPWNNIQQHWANIKNAPQYQEAIKQIEDLQKPKLPEPPLSPSGPPLPIGSPEPSAATLLPKPTEPTMPTTQPPTYDVEILGLTVAFDCYCFNCESLRHVGLDTHVWEFCPVCGEPLQVWNVRRSEKEVP